MGTCYSRYRRSVSARAYFFLVYVLLSSSRFIIYGYNDLIYNIHFFVCAQATRYTEHAMYRQCVANWCGLCGPLSSALWPFLFYRSIFSPAQPHLCAVYSVQATAGAVYASRRYETAKRDLP